MSVTTVTYMINCMSHFTPLCAQNYQSTFYQTHKEEGEEDRLLNLPINTSLQQPYPILPRNTPLSPNSYYSSPWLKALPSQSFPGSQSAQS